MFTNARAMHRKHPDTFQIPSKEEIQGLSSGSLVKVCAGKERFWVKVIDTNQSRTWFDAKVANDLVFTDEHGLSFGDAVHFHDYNIYSIWNED